MKIVYGLLVTATVVSILWGLFVHSVFPIGPADAVYTTMHSELREIIGKDPTARLTGKIMGITAGAIQTAVVLAALPLALTTVGWSLFALRLLYSARMKATPDPQ